MMKTDKNKRVRPKLLKGFRDYPPQEQIAREEMLAGVRGAVELMGFLPLQTASLEPAEALLGSHYTSDNLSELFGFEGPDEVDMALRYEFTVSLARFVATQQNLPLPFRRYQYGNVWRVDKPGPGRYREFMQFDIDIVGSNNLLADAEIIAAMVTIFERLGIDGFEVRYSNRKILNGLIEWSGIEAKNGPGVMRVLDKIERTGRLNALAELQDGYRDESGAMIPGLGLPEGQGKKIVDFLFETIHAPGDQLDRIATSLGGIPAAAQGISELKTIREHLSNMGVQADKTRMDLTVVRGLGYYTGPIFETTLTKLPHFGSVFSGGRYDNLMERFSSQPISAVGSSIGIDRLLAALIELKATPAHKAVSRVLVTVMDRDKLPEYLAIVRELRQAGIPCQIFSGDTKKLSRQVKYGDKSGIPFAIIAGSNEFEAGQVTIKNLRAGAQQASGTSDRGEWLKAEGFQEQVDRNKIIEFFKRQMKSGK